MDNSTSRAPATLSRLASASSDPVAEELIQAMATDTATAEQAERFAHTLSHDSKFCFTRLICKEQVKFFARGAMKEVLRLNMAITRVAEGADLPPLGQALLEVDRMARQAEEGYSQQHQGGAGPSNDFQSGGASWTASPSMGTQFSAGQAIGDARGRGRGRRKIPTSGGRDQPPKAPAHISSPARSGSVASPYFSTLPPESQSAETPVADSPPHQYPRIARGHTRVDPHAPGQYEFRLLQGRDKRPRKTR